MQPNEDVGLSFDDENDEEVLIPQKDNRIFTSSGVTFPRNFVFQR